MGYGADLGGFEDQCVKRIVRDAQADRIISSFAGQEFGGGGDDFFPQAQQYPGEGEETFAERVRKEHEEAQARLAQAGGRVGPTSPPGRQLSADVFDMQRPATPLGELYISGEFVSVGNDTPSSTTRKRVSDALEQAQTKAAETKKTAKKAKRAKFHCLGRATRLRADLTFRVQLIPIDRSTELTDDQFRKMRATYSDRMDAERKKADKVREEREAHQNAMDAIFGVPEACAFFSVPHFVFVIALSSLTPRLPRCAVQIPGLAECAYPVHRRRIREFRDARPHCFSSLAVWKETVVGQMAPFEGGKAARALLP